MKGCPWVTERLSLYPDDLSDREAARVREHLAGCPACRREAAGWLRSRRAFDEAVSRTAVPVGAAEPSTEFFRELRTRVLLATAGRPVEPRGPSPRSLIGGAIAAGVLFVAGLAIGLDAPDAARRPGGQAERGQGERLQDAPVISRTVPFIRNLDAATMPVSHRLSRLGLQGRAAAEAVLREIATERARDLDDPIRPPAADGR